MLDGDSKSERLVPVVFQQEDIDFIPRPLRPFQNYNLDTDDGYDALYRRLTGQPRIIKPPSSGIRRLRIGENVAPQDPVIMKENENSSTMDLLHNQDQKDLVSDTQKRENRRMETIELTIERDFDQYSPSDQEALLRAIRELLQLSSSDLRIRGIRRGSVIITLDLPAEDAQKLLDAVEKGYLSSHGIHGKNLDSSPEMKFRANFPGPLLVVAIEPRTKADQEKLGNALVQLKREDPTFRVHTDRDTGQTLISGMGELHLEIITDRLEREFQVSANVGRPRATYKETITIEANGEGRYIRQSGGRGQYGHVKISMRPTAEVDFVFNDKIIGEVIPREFIKAVEQGIREALEIGPLAGLPCTGIEVDLYDGSYHGVDSSDIAFKIAASMAFQDAAKRARPVLMEPIMSVEVVTPEEYLGEVIGDMTSRRGRVQSMEARDNVHVITGKMPLSEMIGYATDLRSISQGRANYSAQFAGYEQVPDRLSQGAALASSSKLETA